MIAEIVKVIIWPILILVICLLFRSQISDLIRPRDGQNVEVEVGLSGVKIKTVVAGAAAVAAGAAARAEPDKPIDQKILASNLARGIEAWLANLQQPPTTHQILWVDDNPSNNDYLIKVFRDLGIEVLLATSTSSAMDLLTKTSFRLIVSDMSRPPDEEAGLNLVKQIHDKEYNIPIVIYAGYWAAAHKYEEKKFDVALITDDPSSVYAFVLRKILANKS